MKKIQTISKILTIALLTIMLISTFSTVFGAVAWNPDKWNGTSESIKADQVEDFMEGVINIVSIVGSAAAIIFIIVLGVKYMMGSAEEKADYKKTLLPYFIGAVMVFGASILTKFIYTLMKNS